MELIEKNFVQSCPVYRIEYLVHKLALQVRFARDFRRYYQGRRLSERTEKITKVKTVSGAFIYHPIFHCQSTPYHTPTHTKPSTVHLHPCTSLHPLLPDFPPPLWVSHRTFLPPQLSTHLQHNLPHPPFELPGVVSHLHIPPTYSTIFTTPLGPSTASFTAPCITSTLHPPIASTLQNSIYRSDLPNTTHLKLRTCD